MQIIEMTEDFNLFTETFLHLEENKRDDEGNLTGIDGRQFALDNWANMDHRGRSAYDWVYGRESRMPGWATRNIGSPAIVRAEDRILARQEEDGMYD